MTITPADLQAATDVLRDAVNEVEDSDFEALVALRDAARQVIDDARWLIGAIETEMLDQVEQTPKQVGPVTFVAVNDNQERFDHDDLEATVIAVAVDLAVDRGTGEIDPHEAARQAAHLMRTLYVSPSTKAKVGQIRSLGVDPDTVVRKEKKGRKLHEIDTQG